MQLQWDIVRDWRTDARGGVVWWTYLGGILRLPEVRPSATLRN